MANGFGSLYVGASGLQNSQNALNTTANNLANVDTKGYVRQQVYLQIGIILPLIRRRRSANSSRDLVFRSQMSCIPETSFWIARIVRRQDGRRITRRPMTRR